MVRVWVNVVAVTISENFNLPLMISPFPPAMIVGKNEQSHKDNHPKKENL